MNLADILRASSSRHEHLCPRQVLGARMAIYAGELLGLDLPRTDKRLLVTAETDGCAVDGLIAATHCRVGSRTLRIMDFGKVAATFTDINADYSIRLAPAPLARALSFKYSPHASSPWEAMLQAYQVMPMIELFTVQDVQLNVPLEEWLSQAGRKINCTACGEEVINGREIVKNEVVLCKHCSGDGYYSLVSQVRTAARCG